MNTYWAFVKTVTGGFIKVTVQADTSYTAYEIMRATYGDRLLSAYAAQLI